MYFVSIEYIAGFCDGEASLCISNHKVHDKRHDITYTSLQATLEISNTNLQILEEIKDFFNAKSKIFQTNKARLVEAKAWQRRGNGKWKPCYVLCIYGFALIPVLERLLPFLRVKHERAELVLKFLQIRLDQYGGKYRPGVTMPYANELFEIQKQITLLNRRGA